MGEEHHRIFPFVDFAASGEADISFPSSCTRCGQGLTRRRGSDGIPGLVYRDRGRVIAKGSGAPVEADGCPPDPHFTTTSPRASTARRQRKPHQSCCSRPRAAAGGAPSRTARSAG